MTTVVIILLIVFILMYLMYQLGYRKGSDEGQEDFDKMAEYAERATAQAEYYKRLLSSFLEDQENA